MVKYNNGSEELDKYLSISLKSFLLKVYNKNYSLESETCIENIIGFLTQYENLSLEISEKDKPDIKRSYKFDNKDDLMKFAQKFLKAKVLTSSADHSLKRYKHVVKSAWLKEFTEEDKKMVNNYKDNAIVIKAVVSELGDSPQKYLVVIEREENFVIFSKQAQPEEVIKFSEVISISLGFSSFLPTIIKYRKKAIHILSLSFSSIKDCMMLRSAFFRHNSKKLLISPTDTHLKTFLLPMFLLTYNMNKLPFQIPLYNLFKKAEGSHLIAICLQEIPLFKRSSIIKSVENYFEAQGMMIVCTHYMWEIGLFVFATRDLIPYISRTEQKDLSTGFLNVVGNKGGLLISFELMETRFAFLGVHLKHGQKNLQLRNTTLWKLFKYLRFGFDEIEAHLQADYCFFMGDANYRIKAQRDDILKGINDSNFEHLLKFDQLSQEKNSGQILCEFNVTLSFTIRKNALPLSQHINGRIQRMSIKERRHIVQVIQIV